MPLNRFGAILLAIFALAEFARGARFAPELNSNFWIFIGVMLAWQLVLAAGLWRSHRYTRMLLLLWVAWGILMGSPYAMAGQLQQAIMVWAFYLVIAPLAFTKSEPYLNKRPLFYKALVILALIPAVIPVFLPPKALPLASDWKMEAAQISLKAPKNWEILGTVKQDTIEGVAWRAKDRSQGIALLISSTKDSTQQCEPNVKKDKEVIGGISYPALQYEWKLKGYNIHFACFGNSEKEADLQKICDSLLPNLKIQACSHE